MQIQKSAEFLIYLPLNLVFFLKSTLYLTYSAVFVCFQTKTSLIENAHILQTKSPYDVKPSGISFM